MFDALIYTVILSVGIVFIPIAILCVLPPPKETNE